MKFISIYIILFFLGLLSVTAQYSIRGTITDDLGNPIPFANIILQEKDSEINPIGVISDDEGAYVFDNILIGTYQIEISVLGFESKKPEGFELSADLILDFILKEEAQALNEVVVKSTRPVIKQTAEKLVVDLEKSEMINTSLQDVMRKVPGVLVTNNGISVAGNRGVRILINGKTTEYMDVETLLRDLPADNIAKIEVVEQPGAEYEASGTGALINIILKKNVRLGTHGSVNTWAGEDQGFEYGTGVYISSYKNKFNWQTSISHSNPTWREDLFLVRTVGNETYDQETIEPYSPNNFRVSGAVDYYLSDKHSIGISGRWNNRISQRIATSKTIVSYLSSTNTLFSENSFDRDRSNFNINPYYEFKTDTDKLFIDFNYIKFTNDNTNNLRGIEGSTLPFTDRRYIQNGKYNIKTYKFDYTKNFSDNFKLSLGSRYAAVNTDNDLQSYRDNRGNFNFIENESSRFLINETIFALYSKVILTSGEWSFSGGLRYEDSNTIGTSRFTENGNPKSQVKDRPIKKIFPSASISRELSDVLGMSLSYSYRIERPSYNSLNSFAEFLDPFSASQGNPNLAPAYVNKYQFNLTYEGQPFFSIGYSKTEDDIFELIQQNNSTAQIRQREVNVEQNSNWNFRLFAPLSFVKGLEGFTGFILVNTDYQSQTYDVFLNKWYLFWFVQASYELPGGVNFEMSGNYGTGALEGQIEVDWLSELDFSFGKKFLDDKLKVNLGFSEILNRGFAGTIDYGNGTAQVESNGSRQNVQLRLIYSFGSKFGKEKTERDSAQEEARIRDVN